MSLTQIAPKYGTAGQAPRLLLSAIFITALSGRFTVPASLPLGGTEARYVLGAPLLGWAMVWWVTVARHVARPSSGALRWILLLLGYHSCSSLWAMEGARIGQSLTGDVLIIAMTGAVGVSAGIDPAGTRTTILWWLYLTGAVYCTASLLEGATTGLGRSEVFGGGPNIFARVVLLGIVAAIGLSLQTGYRLLLIATPFMLLAAILSASRGALSSAVATGVLAIIVFHRHLRLRRVITGLAMAPLLGWAIWSNDRVQELAAQRFDPEVITASGFSGRETLWSVAKRLFWENPLGGSGIDSFRSQMYASTGFSYPHNVVLEFADDLGFVGLALLFTTLLVSVSCIKRLPLQGNPAAWTFALAGFFVFSCSMFSGDLYDSRFAWILVAAAVPVTVHANRPSVQRATFALAGDMRPRERYPVA